MKNKIPYVLKEKRGEKSLSVEYVSERLAELGIKVSPKTIYNWETGHSQPSPDTLMALCSIYEISNILEAFGYQKNDADSQNILSEDLRRLLEKYRSLDSHGREAVDAIINVEQDRMRKLEEEKNRVALISAENDVDDEGYQEEDGVKIYTQDVAAGLGNYLSDSGPEDYDIVNFPADEIPSGTDFGIRVRGDSMEPDIPDRSIVFIRSQSRLENGQVGIFILNEKALCKKIHIDHDKRKISLISFNKDYDPIHINKLDELRTIGKVIGVYE